MRHLSRIMLTCALCASVWTIFAEGLLLSLTISHVLNPPSPAGDRVVAMHYSFLLYGETTTYVVPGGVGFGEYFAAFGCDDGVDPVARGDYALAWHGNQPDLQVTGTAADPVWRIDYPGFANSRRPLPGLPMETSLSGFPNGIFP